MEIEERLQQIAAKLYARRDEGKILNWADVSIGDDWEPSEHTCHANVDTWCLRTPEHAPVRGYFYFDPGDPHSFVWFSLHSAIRTETGELFDITPSMASQQYPFIVAEESEEEFRELVVVHEVERITHYK